MIGILIFSSASNAGQIRTLNMNADKMKSINLRMGQSTVIRFNDKPNNVVIGNQNYYSVEFIGNDVTIQPLGRVKTNLFVYTPHHVYGFILDPLTGSTYDDIVNVMWKSKGIVLQKRSRNKLFTEKSLKLDFKLKSISVKLNKMTINKSRGTHIIDFDVTNNTSSKIKSKDLEFYLTRSNKNLDVQEYALMKKSVKPFEIVLGRLVVKLNKKEGFTFNVRHKKEKSGKIISRWSL